MRNLYIYITLALMVIFSPGTRALAGDKPLMVIRFVNSPVSYEQRLDKAVKMALEKKPNVVFEVLAVSAETTDKRLNRDNEDNAKLIAEKVVGQIKESGVPAEKIHINQTVNSAVTGTEIQIFVQ